MLKLLGTIAKNVFWVGLTGAVLAGGYFGFMTLRDNRATLEPVPVSPTATAVETRPLQPWNAPLPVRGEGFVSAERSVSLSTVAGGEIVYLHPSIAAEHGRFAKDDILVRIDDAAEQANLRKADADIAAAQSQLALDLSERERTQSLFDRGLTPQKTLDEIEARVAASEYRLEGLRASKAALEAAVAHKVIRAPFDGAILSKQVEMGAVVSPGQTLAEAFTDQSLTVVVNISEAEAALIPGLFDGANAGANVRIAFAGADYAVSGKATNVAPALDERTRTLAVTVALDGGERLRPVAGSPPAFWRAAGFDQRLRRGRTVRRHGAEHLSRSLDSSSRRDHLADGRRVAGACAGSPAACRWRLFVRCSQRHSRQCPACRQHDPRPGQRHARRRRFACRGLRGGDAGSGG